MGVVAIVLYSFTLVFQLVDGFFQGFAENFRDDSNGDVLKESLGPGAAMDVV